MCSVRLLRVFFCLFGVGLLRPSWAQPAPAPGNAFQLAEQQFRNAQQLDYVAPLRTLLAHKTQLEPSRYEQSLATYFSFVGRLSPPTLASLPPAYQTVPLAPLLHARARATSVVLLNEAHNQPAHRAYCRQLLPQLAKLGYTLFAVEALDPADTGLNQRKYPVAASGFYTCEPTMGNLLRAATGAGFYVFGHEIQEAQEKEFADWKQRSNYRDSMQAVNMLAVLRQHPQAKLVALVGYDHVLEKEREGLKRLAAYLRELGGINPVTIDQTLAYQLGPLAPAPLAVTTATGSPTTLGDKHGYVDLQVIHPAWTPRNNRPSWLAPSTGTPALVQAIPAAYVGKSCLVQLYDQTEYQHQGDKAIPLDQYLTTATQQQVTLFPYAAGRAVVVKYRPALLPRE